MNTFHTIRSRQRQLSGPGTDLRLRLKVFVTRGLLDRRIAVGDQRGSNAALSLRARQLVDPRTRQGVARNLRHVVDYADRRESPFAVSAVVIDRSAVRRGREPILGLAEHLEGHAPIHARGVALAKALLTDGLSPLFNPNGERTVVQAIWQIEDALGGS
jgi:hypothetical protein